MLILNDVMKELTPFTVPVGINKRGDCYSITRKQTSFHSQISNNFMMFGWSYSGKDTINHVLNTMEFKLKVNLNHSLPGLEVA